MQKRKLYFLIFSVLLLALVVGCGKNGAIPADQQVASVSVTCTTCQFPNGATGVQLANSNQIIMDLAEGQVESLSVTILGLSGQALSGPQFTLTYSTNDPSALSISPAGNVCAGVWDAQFINCQSGTIPYITYNGKTDPLYPPPLPATPNPVISLTVATPGASTTFSVKIHPVIDTIQLSTTYPPSQDCLSQGQQVQFSAKAFYKGTDVTFDIGYFIWIGSDSTVAVIDSKGEVVPRSPGVSYITAGISVPTGVYSQPFPLVVCPIKSITLMVTSSTSASGTALPLNLSVGDQVTVLATVLDKLGHLVATSPLKFSSSQPALIPFTSSGPVQGIVTADAAGAFYLIAACTPPTCNNGPTGTVFGLPGGPQTPQQLGFGFPVYSQLIPGAIAGTSTTSVFVSGTQVFGGHDNHQLLTINPATLATVNSIILPYVPNSIVFNPEGQTAFIGTDDITTGASLMELAVGQTSVSKFSGRIVGNPNLSTVTGKVLGISPDGTTIIVSDQVNGALFVVSQALNSAQYYPFPGVTSVSFSPDGSTAFLSGVSGVFSLSTNQEILQTVTTTGTNANSSVAYLPEGLAAVVSNVSGDETAYATCNNNVAAATPTTTSVGLSTAVLQAGNPFIVGAAADGTSWIDTAASATPPAVIYPCTPAITLSSPNIVPAALNACSPAQGPTQIVALNNGSEVFATGLNPAQCPAVSAIPMFTVNGASAGSIALSASGIPVAGSATLDSNTLIVGTVTGTTATDTGSLHLINLTNNTNTDTTQVSVPFIPNLIAVQPK